MATSIRLRGGTTSQHSTFTGAAKEVTVDTDKNTIVVHDGSTAGGFPLAKSSELTAKVESLADLGVTASAADLNTTNVTTLGTVEASKVVTADASGIVRLSDNQQIKFGTGDDLEIWHDGSNSYLKDTGTGDLLIMGDNVQLRNASFEYYLTAISNGAVELYYDNSKKFETTSVGADVTGEFIADSYNETYVALSGTTPTVNCESGNVFALSTTGNTTFTFSNPPSSGTAYGFVLKLTAGGTHTITYPASVDWAGGTAPDAPASGETDVLVFYTHDGGTTWYGALSIDAAA